MDAPSLPIVQDPDATRRIARLRDVIRAFGVREFARRAAGMMHAMSGGLWLHRHVWKGRPMAHLVSTDKERLLRLGEAIGLGAERLQFKPLRDPVTRMRRDAWHWDLGGPVLPAPDEELM